jgi:predicted RNA-binding protein with PUA-like domain
MNWLVKEEPSNYGFAQLQRDGRTRWSGVRNPLAQKHLQAMRPGDRVFYYHTGAEKAIVGIATVASAPSPEAADPSGKLHAVDIAAGDPLPRPVRLAEVKADPFFADFALVRMARLSVMPVTDAQYTRILRMSGL